MRKILIIILLMGCGLICRSQDFIAWDYSTKKIDSRTYQIRMSARIQEPWHIYSVNSSDSMGFPTSITLKKNDNILSISNATEEGKLIRKKIDDFELQYYMGEVSFIVTVRLKSAIRTNVKGVISYLICTDERCLPEGETMFELVLGEN